MILDVGVSGESNYQMIGLDQTAETLAEATRQALGGQRADKAVYCLAGCDTDLDLSRLNGCIAALDGAADFGCYNDAFAALRAGSQQPFA